MADPVFDPDKFAQAVAAEGPPTEVSMGITRDPNAPTFNAAQLPAAQGPLASVAAGVGQGANRGIAGAVGTVLGLPGEAANAAVRLGQSGLDPYLERAGFGAAPPRAERPFAGIPEVSGVVHRGITSVAGEVPPERAGGRIAGAVAETAVQALPGFAASIAAAGYRGANLLLQSIGRMTEMGVGKLAAVEGAIAGTGGLAKGVTAEVTKGSPNSETLQEAANLVAQLGAGSAWALTRLLRVGLVGIAGREGAESYVAGRLRNRFEGSASGAGVGPNVARQNLQESIALQNEVPGFQPNLGQATNEPGIAATLQNQARASTGAGLSAQANLQTAQSQAALRQGLAQAPGVPPAGAGTVEQAQGTVRQGLDVARTQARAPVTAAQARLAQAQQLEAAGKQVMQQHVDALVTDAGRQVDEALTRLGPAAATDRRLAGTAVLDVLGEHRAAWSQAMKGLRQAVDPQNRVVLPATDLAGEITTLADTATRESVTVPPLVRRLLNRWSPQPAAGGGPLAGVGPPAQTTPTLTLNELIDARAAANQDIRMAGANLQDRRLLNQLRTVLTDKLDATARTMQSQYPSEIAALKTWEDAAYGEGARRFRQNTVAAVLKPGRAGAKFAVAPEDVIDAFWSGKGKRSLSRIDDLVLGLGGEEPARKVLEPYARQSFLTEVVDPDGTVNTGAMARWLKAHGEQVSTYPTIFGEVAQDVRAAYRLQQSRETLAGGAAARKTAIARAPDPATQRAEGLLADAEKQATADLGVIQKSRAKLFVGEDPVRAVAAVLRWPAPEQGMRELATMVRPDPVAAAGLRRGVWEYLSQTVEAKQANFVGAPFLDPAALRATMQKHEGVLKTLYPSETWTHLDRITRAAEVAQRGGMVGGIEAGGSDTTAYAAAIMGRVFNRIYGVAAGYLSPRFAIGEAALRMLGHVYTHKSGAELQHVLNNALLDPNYAEVLMLMTRSRTTGEQVLKAWPGSVGIVPVRERRDAP